MTARAYITNDTDGQLRVTVHPEARMYSRGAADPAQSWAFPMPDDGVWPLFDSESEAVFIEADQILADHGWARQRSWMSGDVITGTSAAIERI